MEGTLAILGTGRMGEALLSGLLRSGWVTPDRVVCTTHSAERARFIADTYGVSAGTDNAAAAAAADVVLIAVKPQNMTALLAEAAPAITPAQTVISVAAGVRTSMIEGALAD